MAVVPPQIRPPGVYVTDVSNPMMIVGAATSVTAFVGRFASGPVGEPVLAASYAEAVASVGELLADSPVTYALRDFFLGGGTSAVLVRIGGAGGPLTAEDYTDTITGFPAVLAEAGFQLLVIPPDQFGADLPPTVLRYAAVLCASRRAFLLVEPPVAWTAAAAAGQLPTIAITDLADLEGPNGEYAAVYFPNAVYPDMPTPYPLSGAIAGIYATTDATVGVWKAPAGLSAVLAGATGLAVGLEEAGRGLLNQQGINTLLSVSNVGTVVWGARTTNGADVVGSDYKYVPVRRLASYVEASVTQGTRWAVFEPNDAALWVSLQRAADSFMAGLYAQGALAGTSAKDAYFVTCDATTTTPQDQAKGVVNVVIGFAPVRPAEFIVLYVQQQAGTA